MKRELKKTVLEGIANTIVKMIIDRCPCCNRRMFKLESGQWTHLFSKALDEVGFEKQHNSGKRK